MSTSKYIVYQCGVCKRETEIALDARRPDPVRCNITLNCRGKLQRVGERNTKGFLFTPIVPGLDDYVPRGTDLTVLPVPEVQQPVTIFTGSGTITCALVERDPPIDNVSSFYVYGEDDSRVMIEARPGSNRTFINSYMVLYVYEITPTMLKYRKYTYEAPNGIQLLRGLDDSPEGKNLRFQTDDTVKVFVNGVETLNFDRSVANQITLTPAVTVQNSIVEVYVYDELSTVVPDEDLIPLTFRPLQASNADISIRQKNCWGDFYGVQIGGKTRLLMHCLDTGELDVNKSYGIVRAEMVPADTSSSPIPIRYRDLFFLLGKEPFMFQDKELHAFVNAEKVMSSSTILNYRQSVASGDYELVIDSTLIDQVFHPIIPQIPVVGVTEQEATGQTVNGSEVLKRKYILGPS